VDKKTVFVKTKEGDEAMRQRTRLVQRNLRNILIMVDGHASVADLCRRFGDENVAQAALAELLAGGFIAEPANQLDFTSTHSPDTPAEKAEDVPVLTTQVGAPPAQNAAPSRLPPCRRRSGNRTAPASMNPCRRHFGRQSAKRDPPSASAGRGWTERIKAQLAGKLEKSASKPKKAKTRDSGDEQANDAPEPAPIVGGPGISVSLPKLVLIVFVGLAALLVLTLLFYPYGRHLPDIERNASAMLQDPVKVGEIGFNFLPRPHIALNNITVGKNAHLTIASVRAIPDFFSLLGARKVFHELALSDLAVSNDGLGRLALAGAAPAEIRRVTLNGVRLTIGDTVLGGFGGEVLMTSAGVPEKILLRNADGSLKLEMQPKGEGFLFSASGSNWKTPFKPTLTFQAIEAQGVLQPSRLELNKVDGRAYEGLIEGKAALGWAGGAVLAGNLELKHMNSTRLLAALGSDLSAEGELSARLKLDAKADRLDGLVEALRVGGGFEIKRGAARGFDLIEAARSSGRAAARGGETKFEQLTGMVQYGQQESRLGDLRLTSGLLTAGGNLGIARDGKLSGMMNVELKSSAAVVRMPLAIGGTTKAPQLTQSRGR
jgi:hypothetical protein